MQFFNPKPSAPTGKIEKHEEITVEAASATKEKDRGPQKRNEDSVLIDNNKRIYGVFDGIGGESDGAIASQMALEKIEEKALKIADGTNVVVAKYTLEEIVNEANAAVFKESRHNDSGMGTTASVFKVHTDHEGKNWGLIANVGDSRVYKIDKNGKIKQITKDDDVTINDIFNLGEDRLEEIVKKLNHVRTPEEIAKLTTEEAYYFKHRNVITKSIGSGKKYTGVKCIPLKKGDRFIITSDGVHDNFTIEQIEEQINSSTNTKEAVNNLIKEAYNFSLKSNSEEPRAKKDDISAVIITIN